MTVHRHDNSYSHSAGQYSDDDGETVGMVCLN